MATGTIKTGAWSATESVTLPFTAKKDGVLLVSARPDTSSVMYYYISDGTIFPIAISTTGGTRGAASCPIKRGVTYSLNSSSNIKTVTLEACYL